MRRRVLATIAVAFLSLGLAAFAAVAPTSKPAEPPGAGWAIPTDAEIRQILVNRVDVEHRGVGIVVGVIDARGRRVVAYGSAGGEAPRPLDGDTIFEIGSMTKVFTSLALSDMVRKGQVKLDDPVARYLPPTVAVPQRDGKQITLVDLATHSSGLPSVPSNMRPKDPHNPYADYTVEQLYQFLGGYTLTRDIGAQYEYSNLGAGLLGHSLARRASVDYETLVHQRITGPLGLSDTKVGLSAAQRSRLATGHDANRQATANWDLPTLAGAGALHSDTKDLLRFLAAELGFMNTPLKGPMKAQLEVRRPTATANQQVALAWHIRSRPNEDEIVWHNGGTGGFRTFMGFDPKRRVGVVVLTNMASGVGGDDIGFHILSGSPISPPPPPPKDHQAIGFDAATMPRFAGRYLLGAKTLVGITRDGDKMFVQFPGNPQLEIVPEGPADFFIKGADAQISFELAADEQVAAMVFRQGKQTLRMKRAEEVASPN